MIKKRSSIPYLTLPYLPVIYFLVLIPPSLPYLTLPYLTIPKNVLFTDIQKPESERADLLNPVSQTDRPPPQSPDPRK